MLAYSGWYYVWGISRFDSKFIEKAPIRSLSVMDRIEMSKNAKQVFRPSVLSRKLSVDEYNFS